MTKEEAIEYLQKLYLMADITDEYGDMDDTEPYETAIDMAIEALEADTVEVVRCKDCKHAYKRKPINKTAVLCEMFVAGMKDNDFCSCGERSEE